jgi:hypothetical protein
MVAVMEDVCRSEATFEGSKVESILRRRRRSQIDCRLIWRHTGSEFSWYDAITSISNFEIDDDETTMNELLLDDDTTKRIRTLSVDRLR